MPKKGLSVMASPAPAPVPAPEPKPDDKTGGIKDPRFWVAATERAVLTLFQSFAAELLVYKSADIAKMGLSGLPWTVMLSVSVFAALTSFVTSVGKLAGRSKGPAFARQLRGKKAVAEVAQKTPEQFPADVAKGGASGE